MNRRALLMTSLLPLAAACQAPASASSPDAGAAPVRTTQVETLVMKPRVFEDRLELTGTLEAEEDAILSAQSMGTLERLLPLGTEVRKNQLVAALDAELLLAAVRQAQATLEVASTAAALAEDNLRRQEPLYKDNVISALEFKSISAQRSQAVAQKSQAEAILAQARKQLANTKLLAPFDGVVEQHLADVGEQVSPGMPVVRVTNTQRMKVKAGVPERYAAEIQRGASIQIGFSAYGLPAREGRLTFVGRTIDPRNRTFQVEALVDNDDGKLKPEMVARLLLTRSRQDTALAVPLAAVLRDETGEAVFLVKRKDGIPVADRREVKTGVTSQGEVIILEGLKSGDEVVISGQQNLTRGDRVEVTRRAGPQAS